MQRNPEMMRSVLVGMLTAGLLGLVGGCSNLPGSKRAQGTVIGGTGGAVAGAAIAGSNPVAGALIGGLLGAGGGYIVGGELDRKDEEATQSAMDAFDNPATPQQAIAANTADLNGDGFVTLDELVAMQSAGLSANQIVARAEATNMVFEFDTDQTVMLIEAGFSADTIARIERVNLDRLDVLMAEAGMDSTALENRVSRSAR
ncbi:MAG: hypothetical protein AAGK78_02690 [Planctomycetota bacterium]